MSEGGSLSIIVREYFGYIARDSSKSPQEKTLGILGAAVRFTHQATQTGDQETLQYLLNEAYVKDFILAIPSTRANLPAQLGGGRGWH